MKHGNLTLGYASWGFRETPLEKQLQIASRDGINLIELGIHGHENDFLQLSPSNDQIEWVKNLFKKYNVKLLCASTGNEFTSESHSECYEAVKNVKNVVETCAKLGVKYLRIFAGFTAVEEVKGERYDRLISCLNDVYAYAENYGVTLVVETHGGVNGFDDGVLHFASVSTKIETVKDLISKVKGIKFNFDPANLSAVGETDLVSYYNEISSVVEYLHLKDFKTLESGHLLPTYMGNGSVNWQELLPVLKEKSVW